MVSSSFLKVTFTFETFLTNVPFNPRGHFKLERLYKRILFLLEKVPKDSAYRIHTEGIICHRLSIVKEAKGDRKKIEDNISCGKLEMLISQAEDEYKLLQKVILWKIWEPLMEIPPKGQWDWPPVI